MKIYFNAYDKIASTNLDQVVALSVKAIGKPKNHIATSLVQFNKHTSKLYILMPNPHNEQGISTHTRTITMVDTDSKFTAIPYQIAKIAKNDEDDEDDDDEEDDRTELCVGCCDNCGKEIYEDDDNFITDKQGNLFCCDECHKHYANTRGCYVCDGCGRYISYMEPFEEHIKDKNGHIFCCNSCKKSFYEEEDE